MNYRRRVGESSVTGDKSGPPARHRNDRHDPPLPHSLLVRLASTAARSARDRRHRQANELTLAIHRVRRHEWGVRVPADTP